jgi:hypothetical protein
MNTGTILLLFGVLCLTIGTVLLSMYARRGGDGKTAGIVFAVLGAAGLLFGMSGSVLGGR